MFSLSIPPRKLLQWFRRLQKDDTMSAAQIKLWQKCFNNGRESVKSDPHSRKPATSEHLTMLNVYGLQSIKIGNRDCESRSFPKLLCPRFWCSILHETSQNKIHSVASTTRTEGTKCCSCYWHRENWVRSTGAYFEWHHCPTSDVSWTFFNECLYFS